MLQNIHFLALPSQQRRLRAPRATDHAPSLYSLHHNLKHGDGNPKKFLHKQVTTTHMCTDGPCSIEKEDSETYTIEWNASIADPRGFFSAGFAVSEAITTGVTKACSNQEGTENQSLCVWWSLAHTEYEVQDWEMSGCGSSKPKRGVYKITAPNADDGKNTSCCVRNNCRGNGDEYWADDKAIRADVLGDYVQPSLVHFLLVMLSFGS
ncbi:hypothetical protein CPAR01_06078 [Colletotrichum paranaense]|uniref:Uncharacterized protein n=1 Tax=Colletotrichum paranaense TaxID=1914294 RepID=A0ABQ9SUK9_9PEZI|nr:uncharacterized protein CPAR01_06078 [Colletotrichum paranaense]KAK1542691.1 hypothetical protein CPAR01_06078 [Colletotrichum paranaense]